MFVLMKAKFAGKCNSTGESFLEGDWIWFGARTRQDKGKAYLAKVDPPFADDYVKRDNLTKCSVWGLRQLCLLRGISAQHGRRKRVYNAKKHELVEWIMGYGTPGGVFPVKPAEEEEEIVTPEEIKEVEQDFAPQETEQETEPVKSVQDLTENQVQEMIKRAIKELFGTPITHEDIEQTVSRDLGEFQKELEKKGKEIDDLIPKLVAEQIKKQSPTTIVIKKPGAKRLKKLGLQHKQMPILLEYIGARCNVYLVGPAGSGKSRAAKEVADALQLKFFSESVSQQSPVSLLKGYMDAKGNYVSTSFRRAFEKGGIFLLDEMDAGNANVITALNSAVSLDVGQIASFPDGMIKKHKDFICIAAANTIGRGGDREYVGRNPLDAASLDRFIFIEWEYDEVLERAICTARGYDQKWVDHVQACRKAAGTLKIRLVISPRASFFGGALLAVGRDWDEVEDAVIFKGVDKGTVEKIRVAATGEGSSEVDEDEDKW